MRKHMSHARQNINIFNKLMKICQTVDKFTKMLNVTHVKIAYAN